MRTWTPLTWTPRLKLAVLPDSTQEYLWPGGVMTREIVELCTSYRLANGTRKEYTTTAGWHPWRWTWAFERMPYFYVGRLWAWRDTDKGTADTPPYQLALKPRIQEIGTESLNTDWVPVDIESLSVRRQMGPRGQLIGYSGSCVFVSSYNNEAVGRGSSMVGGEPLTDDMPT